MGPGHSPSVWAPMTTELRYDFTDAEEWKGEHALPPHEPRFIVASVTGFSISVGTGRLPISSYSVLDRAVKHRVMKGLLGPLAAKSLAAELNAREP